MSTPKLFSSAAVTTSVRWLKNNIQYALLAVMVISLFYLFVYTNGKIDELKVNENKLESELLSLKNTLQKEASFSEDRLKAISEELGKVYSLSLEQAKTISQIPTDNTFFKKWVQFRNEEFKNTSKELQTKLNSIQDSISRLKTVVDRLESQKNSEDSAVPKSNVETISL